MAKTIGTVEIEDDLCKGCDLCVAICPENVLEMTDHVNVKGWLTVALVREGCTGCALCSVACPDGVFSVYREARARDEGSSSK